MFEPSHTSTRQGSHGGGVAIRSTDSDEGRTLAAVAARDSQRLPAGPWLVAELEDRAVAVLSLSTGSFVADPFTRTVELRALLELRAAQLEDGHGGRLRRRGGHPRRRRLASRAALAG